MQYGFVIDNRKCIGCHACTVACKSEHEVPLGVNRTWVKQVEKGTFPNTQRLFSVMRCNHCTNAPCVEICPTRALFIRDDGIVDFDNRRCIGCKGCMQACPYDALYIDPSNNTAAKCNYCVHRVDIGLEPACVNVCPEHAIISGDMDNPDSEIAELLAGQKVTVRKAEKGTQPNLFYINGDEASLNPSATERTSDGFWNSQSAGVGHFARFAEDKKETGDIVKLAAELAGKEAGASDNPQMKSIDLLLGKARRVYDSPEKGLLWGTEVVAYVWTKAISAGVVMVALMGIFFVPENQLGLLQLAKLVVPTALIFLALTGALLVKDLDRPDRFLYVLLRPQWKSWLVRGGYIITGYGAILALWGLAILMGWHHLHLTLLYVATPLALMTAGYTAFLFAQSKGRDFWQSPLLLIHMLLHGVMAGSAVFVLAGLVGGLSQDWQTVATGFLLISLLVNLLLIGAELFVSHATSDAAAVAHMIKKGSYASLFKTVVLGLGHLLPLGLLLLNASGIVPNDLLAGIAAIAALVGIWFTEKIWVEAPQRLPLS